MANEALDLEQTEIIIVRNNTICRLCASQNEKLIGIYSEEGLSNGLSNLINLYLPIKVDPTDELPLQCCWNCASTLLAWHDLVTKCVTIDKKFRSLEIVTEKGPVDEVFDNPANTLSDDNDACDNEGIESKATTTSLNDFSQARNTSPKRRKKQDTITCFPLQETTSLETYITDIIDPELAEYKIDIDHEQNMSDDEDKTDLQNMEEEERPYFGCQFCSAIFFARKAVAEHVKEEHNKQTHQPIKSLSDENIKREKRKHTKIDQEAINAAKVVVDGRIYYNCKECGKNLHSPYTFTWHMRIHTGERPYVCDLCGKQFRVSQGLVRHLRETHEGIKKFPCDLCGRMFATRRNVEEHRRIHTNERPYVCDLCGKSFKQKASLFVHKRSHRNYFPFKCSYCNQGFRTKPPLLVHITRHTGEKPYKCDICGRCFRIKYELKRHRLIHSDEKPWVCNICGFSFRQKRYLRNHTKSNHAV